MDRLRAGLSLQPPVFTYTCCFHNAPITAGLEGVCRQIGNWWWVAKLTCAWKFYSEKTSAQRQSHSLNLGSFDPVAWRTVMTGDCQAAVNDQEFFGCHILLKALQRHLLPPPSQPLALQVNSSACSARSQASHAVGLTLPNLNSSRVWDPLVTLTWFSKLAKASTQGVAAVACDIYGEPQVRAECQQRSSGRRVVLKGHGKPPYQRYWPLPEHPIHPSIDYTGGIWHNGFLWKWTQQPEFKTWMRLFALHFCI